MIKCSDASLNKACEILVEALRKVVGEVADKDTEEMNEKVRTCDPINVVVVESLMFKKLGLLNREKKFSNS